MVSGVAISDIHFGALDPQKQFNILKEQFINVIEQYPVIDYILICGDLYDKKFFANSPAITYASYFIDEVIRVAKEKGSTVVLISGTFSHEAGQLSNFYHYINNCGVDFHIVESIQFINIKGHRLLCIPELYGLDESVYQKFLFESGYYDLAFLHGTFEGAVYGNNVGNGRLFRMQDFAMCKGFMVGGHVHTPGCHKGYFYYTGCPYRWKFGEEEDKGFLTMIYDKNSRRHYINFNKIVSDSYITVKLKDLVSTDPKQIIEFINKMQRDEGIDYLKIKFEVPIKGADKVTIDGYYRNNPRTFVEFLDILEEKKIQDKQQGIIDSEYDFILDPKISDLEKFCMYVNMKEGTDFIKVDQLREILSGSI